MSMEQARFNMIEQQIRPWEVLDPAVLDLLAEVRREEFVPLAYKAAAFTDVELPLGGGRNMLMPKIEARLLQELGVKKTDKVLEVGAGSGYMAALLAARAEYVYTVDIDPAMVEMARKNLKRAGVANVSVELGDASRGWAKRAPYDVIVVSGSTPVLPEEFKQQLKIGGRLVAIVGELPVMEAQLITRSAENAFSCVNLFETVATPLDKAVQRERFVF